MERRQPWIYFQWNPPGTDWREPAQPLPRAGHWRRRTRARRATRRSTASARCSRPATSLATDARASSRRRATSTSSRFPPGTVRRLTQTVADERDPHFSADGRRVFFVARQQRLLDRSRRWARPAADRHPRRDPHRRIRRRPQGQRGTLEAQQRELFDVIRDRVRADSIRKAEQKAREALRVKPFYLRHERAHRVAVRVADRERAAARDGGTGRQGASQTRVPNYVTTSGYTEELTVRTKVGDTQTGGRVAFMKLPSGDLTWLQVVSHRIRRKPPSQATHVRLERRRQRRARSSPRRATTSRATSTSSTRRPASCKRSTRCATARGSAGRATAAADGTTAASASGSCPRRRLRAPLHDGRRRRRPAAAHERQVGGPRRRSSPPTSARSSSTRAKARRSSSISTACRSTGGARETHHDEGRADTPSPSRPTDR